MSDSTIGTTTEGPREGGAVIIGGGPSGLAAALMLAKRGWTDISIIEKSPSADHYDPSVAYVYQIDRRGQYFTDIHGLTEKMAQVSVDTKEFTLTTVPAKGPRKEFELPQLDNSRPPGYWLPRNVLQQILYDEIVSKYPDQVKVYFSSSCDKLERGPGGSGIDVKASLCDPVAGAVIPRPVTLRPRLVVGADGLNSMVRETLREWDTSDGSEGGGGKSRFEMRKLPSGASGLRFKVLTLPPGLRLSRDEQDDERAKSHKAYAISSRFKDSKRTVRIGMLPWGPEGGGRENDPRGGNFITLPGHPLWDVKTEEEAEEFLEDNFPQTAITAQLGEGELSRFAKAKGGRFPDPQYCPGHQWLSVGPTSSPAGADEEASVEAGKGDPDSRPAAGVVLVGDAIHAFPPDLGQGVNSALEDILVLERALESCGDKIEVALPRYEESRAPDTKALVRLCQIGYPWQYRQPSRIRAKIWTANFVFRTMFLSKVLPSIFKPQAFMLMLKSYDRSYSEILTEANRTSRRITLMGATLLLGMLCRRHVAGAMGVAIGSIVSLGTRLVA